MNEHHDEPVVGTSKRLLIMFIFVVIAFILLAARVENGDYHLRHQDLKIEANSDRIELNRKIQEYVSCTSGRGFLKRYNENQRALVRLSREQAALMPRSTPAERKIVHIYILRANVLEKGIIPLPKCGQDPRKD